MITVKKKVTLTLTRFFARNNRWVNYILSQLRFLPTMKGYLQFLPLTRKEGIKAQLLLNLGEDYESKGTLFHPKLVSCGEPLVDLIT